MAGTLKPSIVGLKREVPVTVLGYNMVGKSGMTNSPALLFNAVHGNTSYYGATWYYTYEYVSIKVDKPCNIWRLGCTDGSYYTPFTVVLDLATGINIAPKVTVTPAQGASVWGMFIKNLPPGSYKLYGASTRTDSEWYVEQVTNSYLIKQGDNYYTIKTEFYDEVTTHNFVPLTLSGSSIPNEADISNFAFIGLETLTTSMTKGSDTFRPLDKLNDNFEVELFVVL